ncbi:MAG TPA: hypothetical protein DC049_19320, partial [Spirochaetia bacterium]|nr:hypothetical protein [Spirochaetia bacterium]
MILHCLASSGTWPQDALDGGNRILIELSRRWSKKPGVKIVFHIYDKFQSFYRKHGLDQIEYSILPSLRLQHANLFFFFLFRTLCNVFWALTVKPVSSGQHYVYSSSDAWPDFWAGLILKLRFGKKIVWIAALYLFVPFVLSKNSFHRGRGIIIFLRGFFYYLMQYPVKYLIKLQADMVFVTSEPDRDFFITGKRPREKIIVIRGGVDADTPRSLGNVPAEYDAVFIGRFHAQKGAVELIDIWKKVCARKNGSRLAMIGAG